MLLPKAKINQQNKTRKQSTDLKDAFIYTLQITVLYYFPTKCLETVELLEILATCSSALSKPMRERGGERKKERKKQSSRGKKKDWEGGNKKKRSHLEGFQQAHTVTRVIRRNMPPVDRMMYSELRPKPR